MSVFKPKYRKKDGLVVESESWWYDFVFAGRRYREPAKTASKTLAKEAEKKRRRELEEGFNNVATPKKERVQTLADVATPYLEDYKVKHRSATFAEYAIGHVTRLLGKHMLIEITDKTVRGYQTERLKEGASPKSVNEEVGFLLRLLGDQGDMLRNRLRRAKALKLKVPPTPGKVFSSEHQEAMLKAALESTVAARLAMERKAKSEPRQKGQKQGGSPLIYPALVLALNAGMRDSEIKFLKWEQVDLVKKFITVGRSKTEAGQGRTIPLNEAVLEALVDHASWYVQRFGQTRPEWFVFPGGSRTPTDPARPVTTLRTAWGHVRESAGVSGRWHDNRHTLITELAENGAGDQTIMEIAGHVSRQMLSRYSHIRMEAKRRALEDLNQRRRAQDAKRADAENGNVSDGKDGDTPKHVLNVC